MSFKTTPYAHQLEDFELSKDRELFGFLWEMGLGKSKTLIDTVAHLYKSGKIEGLVLLAPKGTYLNWYHNEIPKHLPSDIPHDMAYWSTPLLKDEKRALERVLRLTSHRLKIVLVNIEAMSHPKAPSMLCEFMRNYPSLICVDESTSIKNHKAARTKTLIRIGKLAPYKRIMTGTPITQSPLDLYSQCQFLCPSLLGYDSYYSFKARYAQVVKLERVKFKTPGVEGRARPIPTKTVGYRNLDKLAEELKAFTSRRLKQDCLDLPEKIYTTRYVELTPEQKRVYDELKSKSLADLRQGGTVTVLNVLTKLMRLHQITCGHTKTDEGAVVPLESNRIEVLLETVAEAGGKVIIWANYQHDIRAIATALTTVYGYGSVATYYGQTTAEEREAGLKAFSDPDSEVKFFVGSPTTGGKGLTLVSASTVIYYSYDYNLEVHLQSQDRAHRIGQTKNVTYVYLVSPNTVDQKILRSLKEKKSLADIVLDDGKEIQSLLE